MENLETRTVREIAIEAPATTRVFEEYKIDYCCHGNTPFIEACKQADVSPEEIGKKIARVLERDSSTAAETTLTDLVGYIFDKHHTYTKREIEQLTPLMAKVATRHGERHPELFELQKLFQSVCNDLGPHMIKEEMVLFPYVIQLEKDISRQVAGPPLLFGTINNPVRTMSTEHEIVGNLLEKMRAVSNEYQLPEGACTSFTALYSRLEDLERDLHQHIHLENNLLFPKAIEMEVKVFDKAYGLF